MKVRKNGGFKSEILGRFVARSDLLNFSLPIETLLSRAFYRGRRKSQLTMPEV
jgi:hypothetical protein